MSAVFLGVFLAVGKTHQHFMITWAIVKGSKPVPFVFDNLRTNTSRV
jgi:hypothetical protein